MTSSTTVSAPDFNAVKTRQQATWASGDYAMVATLIQYPAEQLAEHADVQAGWKVLDVATGSGNAAIAAGRRNADVTGLDYVPALLERARERATAERLDINFMEGDAEKMPFADGSFDAVLSIYGCMFTPDHGQAAREIARVCKPGGTIGLACWTPTGFIGEMFRVVSGYVPPAPGLTPPTKWGDEAYQRSLFGDTVKSAKATVRQTIFRFREPGDYIEYFLRYYGPTIKAHAALPPDKQAGLARDITELAKKHDRNRGRGPVAIASDYLETIMTRA